MTYTNPKVLFVGTDSEGLGVMDILKCYAAVTQVQKVPEILPAAQQETYDAVFCEWEFPGGTWRDVLAQLAQLRLQPPVIVLNRWGGENQWVEVLQAGAFDLLAWPFSSYQMLTALEHAIASKPREADCVSAE